MAAPKNAISPTRGENYPEWYQQVVKAADLAETSAVRGCMVIKPWGLSMWENVRRSLDARLRETGHRNAYFPLFIPLSYLQKEAEHVEGFAKECAVVTHHRLETREGKLVPAGELEEPLIVRPTSETIIGESFARWVESYRDLPLLINQWANVVRWEMRTRVFLRTTEFLWQEGHTAHATAEEAIAEAEMIHGMYAELAENVLAMPVIRGRKSAAERFPGAVDTMTIEAMMQDRRALQSGTSHFLGQNFARSSNIKFMDRDEQVRHAWTTSWGVSTRLLGGLIMTHADDDGMIMPPRVASAHVVILPIAFKAENPAAVIEHCQKLARELRSVQYAGHPIEVEVDTRETGGGEKLWGWVKKGVPLRLEIGPRDMASDSVFMGRRDRPTKEKRSLPRAQFIAELPQLLDEIQGELLARAKAFRKEHTRVIDSKSDFEAFFEAPKVPEGAPTPIHGGFALTHWSGDPDVERRIKDDLGVTIRCLPEPGQVPECDEPGTCPFTGKPSARRAVWAKAY